MGLILDHKSQPVALAAEILDDEAGESFLQHNELLTRTSAQCSAIFESMKIRAELGQAITFCPFCTGRGEAF